MRHVQVTGIWNWPRPRQTVPLPGNIAFPIYKDKTYLLDYRRVENLECIPKIITIIIVPENQLSGLKLCSSLYYEYLPEQGN